jgi:large subunit ribosomal protein L19
MNQALLHHVAAQSLRKTIPVIEAGMSVKVAQKIREGEKERVQNFEGLVIATNNGSGVNATFTVRKIVSGVGVEKVFPLHGKNIVKIEILKKAKVRRSKLYYMRELRGKAARMSETHVRETVVDDEADAKAAEASKKEEEAATKEKEPEGDKKADESADKKPAGDDEAKDGKKDKPAEEPKADPSSSSGPPSADADSGKAPEKEQAEAPKAEEEVKVEKPKEDEAK